MNLVLHLETETEIRLKQQADLTGKKPEVLAIEAIEEKLAQRPSSARQISVKEWIKRFDAWVASHPSRNQFVDDSRESIYEGRGE